MSNNQFYESRLTAELEDQLNEMIASCKAAGIAVTTIADIITIRQILKYRTEMRDRLYKREQEAPIRAAAYRKKMLAAIEMGLV